MWRKPANEHGKLEIWRESPPVSPVPDTVCGPENHRAGHGVQTGPGRASDAVCASAGQEARSLCFGDGHAVSDGLPVPSSGAGPFANAAGLRRFLCRRYHAEFLREVFPGLSETCPGVDQAYGGHLVSHTAESLLYERSITLS